MTKIFLDLDDEEINTVLPPEEAMEAKEALRARCKSAGFEIRERESVTGEGHSYLEVGIKCAREQRWLYLGSNESILQILSIPFENFVFISGHEAICS